MTNEVSYRVAPSLKALRSLSVRFFPFSETTPTTDERERLKQLERENKELRRANDILKAASAFFAQAELDRRIKS